MNDKIRIFYYSRAKLGLYVLFNVILLGLAVLFTLTVFPHYSAVYIFAIGACLLSFFGALFVFVVPMPLAVISENDKNRSQLAVRVEKHPLGAQGVFGTRPVQKINLTD